MDNAALLQLLTQSKMANPSTDGAADPLTGLKKSKLGDIFGNSAPSIGGAIGGPWGMAIGTLAKMFMNIYKDEHQKKGG